MDKSSILLVGNYSNRTGYAWNNIYRLFNVIAGEMHARGVSVCLSFAKIEPPVTIIDQDIPVKYTEFDPINSSFSDIVRFIRFIRANHIKFVYMTDMPTYSGLYFLLKIFGVKKILIHCRISVPSPYPAKQETGMKKILKSLIGKTRYLTPDRIYAVSKFVRNRLVVKNCIPDNKVVVILNGINIDKYLCEETSNTQSQVRIFTGARAVSHKGVPDLIDAAYLLVTKHNIENFIIEYAGSGSELNDFVTRVHELELDNKFMFLGQLEDTSKMLCSADIVVVPSAWGDACPSAVSEALAAGRPLVSTKAGGIPELIGDELNAVLVPPSNAEELANALAVLIEDEDKRREIGMRARKHAEKALDENRYYADVMNQIVSDLF